MFILYFAIVINLLAFVIMGYDKMQAKGNKARIAEKKLLLLALFLGSPGIYLGMLAFRHKTKKPLFKYGVPVLLICNAWLYRVVTRIN